MNQLEVFLKVARHLINQKEASVNRIGPKSEVIYECRYRTDKGLSCAVGCLINDEHYSEERLEGQNIDRPTVRAAVARSLGTTLSPSDIELLCRLQGLHDTLVPEEWEEALIDMGVKLFNLDKEEFLQSIGDKK